MASVPSLWPLRLYGLSAISLAFAPLWPQCHLFGLCAFMALVPSLWPLRLYGPSAISLAFALLWPQCHLFGLCALWRQCHLFGLCASMAPVPSLWPLRLFGPKAISLAFALLWPQCYGPSAISLAFAPLWPQCHLFGLCASMAPVPSLWPLRLYGPSAISLAFALLWPQCHLFGLCAFMAPVPSLWPLRFYGFSSAASLAFLPLWPSPLALCACMAPHHLCGLCACMAPAIHLFGLCAFVAPVQSFMAPVPSLMMAPLPSLRPLRLVCPSAISYDCRSAISYDCPSAISLAFSLLWLSAIFSKVRWRSLMTNVWTSPTCPCWSRYTVLIRLCVPYNQAASLHVVHTMSYIPCWDGTVQPCPQKVEGIAKSFISNMSVMKQVHRVDQSLHPIQSGSFIACGSHREIQSMGTGCCFVSLACVALQVFHWVRWWARVFTTLPAWASRSLADDPPTFLSNTNAAVALQAIPETHSALLAFP